MNIWGATPKERKLLRDRPTDLRGMLMMQVDIATLREMRLMREIAGLAREDDSPDAMRPLEELTIKDGAARGKAAQDSEQTSSEQVTKRRSAFEARQQLEGQLHRLHELKLKTLEALAKSEGDAPPAEDGVRLEICLPDNGRGRADDGGEEET